MTRRARLDAELVRRGLVASREQAVEAIEQGRVRIAGAVATKPATAVERATALHLEQPAEGERFASRGGRKLTGALDAFAARGNAVVVAGRRCLDAGASTGGFTDVLLRRGAREVVAVDVGYGQLAWPLRTDARVRAVDRTNARTLTPEQIGGRVELTVADLSFISLSVVLPALARCTRPDGDIVVMVKPQFEVGRDRLGKGGVVREPELRAAAVRAVAAGAEELGLGVVDLASSPIAGPAGNIEYFVWFRSGAAAVDDARIEAEVRGGVP